MEQIYTIPIKEAFEESEKSARAYCPFCRIYNKFEKNELDLILGASMMEPDVRMKTNSQGFCKDHFTKILKAGKKLPTALILESHLEEVAGKISVGKILKNARSKSSAASLGDVASSCYLCERLSSSFEKVASNTVYLWQADPSFRRLFSAQRAFCVPHYSAILTTASKMLKAGDFGSFSSCARGVEEKYFEKIRENNSYFIKKFDYRYENEPWNDAKDAVERAVEALSGFDPE